MTISTLTPLDRTSPTFRTEVDTFFGSALPAFVGEANELAANLNAIAAGGAYAFPYVFDSATADADPGVGKLRLGSTTQNTSTVLRIDNVIVGGTDISAVFTDLAAGTNSVKGSIRLVKQGDPTKWLIFDITGVSGSGYRNLVGSVRASSETSPLSHDDALIAYVQRSGDRGDTGVAAQFQYIKVSDRKAGSSGGGGNSASSWAVRVLNTVDWNDITGASLSSNVVTLPAGTYEFEGRAPAYSVNEHQLRLYSITSAAAIINGSSAYSDATGSYKTQTDSIMLGKITLAATTQVRLEHMTGTPGETGTGFGRSMGNLTGATGVFAELLFRKVA